jgi:hypothetical protein
VDRLFVPIREIRGFLYAIRIDKWTRMLMGTNDGIRRLHEYDETRAAGWLFS